MTNSKAQPLGGLGVLRAAVAVVAATAAVASAGPQPGDFQRLLTKLPNAQARCGAMIVDLQSGEVIYAQNATEAMTPASNQKLLVLAAAIELLGPDFSFHTRVATRGRDLIIIGDGDPALGDPRVAEERKEEVLAAVDRWADALRKAGATNIAGDLVVDATVLDEQYYHPDWPDGDRVKWYGAPVGGLNVNDNCVELTVWPEKPGGAPAGWELFPPNSTVEVVNQCRSAAGNKKASPLVDRSPSTGKLSLRGTVASRATLQSVSVPYPVSFAADVIRSRLRARGINIAGKTRFEPVRQEGGQLPEDCTVVAEETTPLAEVLQRIGRDSQNLFAECLFKRLGYEWSRKQAGSAAVGSWDSGRAAVSAALAKAGCDLSRLVVADGSGLSRNDRMTAADFVAILKYMYSHKDRDLFVSSLAGNRNGGSLKKRMKSLEAGVYAKTGYIHGVRTLSGYVHTTDDRWYAFSVLFNGIPGSTGAYNTIHDQVCRLLAGEAGGRGSGATARKR